MTREPPRIQLLQASVDPEDESEFRILVNDDRVKYLVIDHGVFDPEEMCFGPSLVSLLPPFPPSDWNTGRISRDPETRLPHFSAMSNNRLPGITNTWHSVQINHLEFHVGRKLRSNVYEATCPRLSSTVIIKFARFACEIPQLDHETAAYKWISGHGIGPEFLAHLTEEGRVIGFVIARVTDCRHAEPEDFAVCYDVLGKLHGLSIKHGDINKHNILIHDGNATLIDFDQASPSAAAEELEEELKALHHE